MWRTVALPISISVNRPKRCLNQQPTHYPNQIIIPPPPSYHWLPFFCHNGVHPEFPAPSWLITKRVCVLTLLVYPPHPPCQLHDTLPASPPPRDKVNWENVGDIWGCQTRRTISLLHTPCNLPHHASISPRNHTPHKVVRSNPPFGELFLDNEKGFNNRFY